MKPLTIIVIFIMCVAGTMALTGFFLALGKIMGNVPEKKRYNPFAFAESYIQFFMVDFKKNKIPIICLIGGVAILVVGGNYLDMVNGQ